MELCPPRKQYLPYFLSNVGPSCDIHRGECEQQICLKNVVLTFCVHSQSNGGLVGSYTAATWKVVRSDSGYMYGPGTMMYHIPLMLTFQCRIQSEDGKRWTLDNGNNGAQASPTHVCL